MVPFTAPFGNLTKTVLDAAENEPVVPLTLLVDEEQTVDSDSPKPYRRRPRTNVLRSPTSVASKNPAIDSTSDEPFENSASVGKKPIMFRRIRRISLSDDDDVGVELPVSNERRTRLEVLPVIKYF